MREFLSPKRESQIRKDEMSDAADIERASALIQDAFPAALGRVEQRIETAARRLGWPWSKAKKVWYGETSLIRAHQMAALEQAQMKEARRAHRQFIEKTARIAEFLELQDPEFHRPDIQGLRGMANEASPSSSQSGPRFGMDGTSVSRVDSTGDNGD